MVAKDVNTNVELAVVYRELWLMFRALKFT